MKTWQRITFPIVIVLALIGFSVAEAAPRPSAPQAAGTSFHFEFAADSRGDYTVLPVFSRKMVTFRPAFGFFAGDLCTTFDTTCIRTRWMPAMDGNNHDGMLAKTFASRGNHDSGSLSTWQGLWDSQGMAARVRARHFRVQTSDATYSFDYGNSHFVVVDNPSGGAKGWTSRQITWLSQDLAAAERRGAVHEFLISHGPMYTVTTEHAGDLPSSALKAVLNRHPRLIGFHGHEHVTAYTLVRPTLESGINRYRQFTLGRAGAPGYPVSKRVTWAASQNAFADVAVNGSNVTVNIYSQGGSRIYSRSFTNGVPAALPPASTTILPTATPALAARVDFLSLAAYDGHALEDAQTRATGGSVHSGEIFRLGSNDFGAEDRAILALATARLLAHPAH